MAPVPHILVEPEEQSKEVHKYNISQAGSIEARGTVNTAQGTTEPSTPQPPKSWYGGTWPRGNKADAVTQIAKESISAAGGAASEAVAKAQRLPSSPLRKPAVYLSRNTASSSRSLPLAATTTKLTISSDSTNQTDDTEISTPSDKTDGNPQDEPSSMKNKGPLKKERTDTIPSNGSKQVKADDLPGAGTKPLGETKATSDQPRWLHWFSRGERPEEEGGEKVDPTLKFSQPKNAPKERPHSILLRPPTDRTVSPPKERRKSDPSPASLKFQDDVPFRSWLTLWGKSTAQTTQTTSASATGVAASIAEDAGTSSSANQGSRETELKSDDPTPAQPADPVKSSGWAFWSRDHPKDKCGKTHLEVNVGQLALAGSPSQSKPENAVVDVANGVPKHVGKKQRPQSLEIADNTKRPRGDGEDIAKRLDPSDTSREAAKSKLAASPTSKVKRLPDNLLLPSFRNTYSAVGRPSLIQQLGRLLQLIPSSDLKHVGIVSNPPKVKQALAVGIHGYFPAPLIRSVLGQPTGTSIRFADGAAKAIGKWTENQGYTCEVEKVALEGEGKIAERIDLLWKLMLNWIDKIRRADFVMIACHSQGVPVALMLVAKLISFGCVNSAKLGVCAMAGVNLGPFVDYKSRWIGGSAGELFDFVRPDSQVSKDYEAALDIALRFGVKIVYIGSIDDQLVSLESSTFGSACHPNIFRAIFVDGRVHAPDFLTHLVGFALKLRNLGISDHGLIRELSAPLAGSLYTGEGHSRIYEDEAVYYLAVEHALETTSLGELPVRFQRGGPMTSQNPYILPFAMRGVLEEEYVRNGLHGEVMELIKQFDDWKPSSKTLKDVKFRLEGVKSKL